jgi:peptidylprolyl isomerase
MNKDKYKQDNEKFMAERAADSDYKQLAGGVCYRVIAEGTGRGSVTPRSVVTVNYSGRLISGHVFDNSWERGYPEAFRVSELIEGFQTALLDMHIGDRREVCIPWQRGYGKRPADDIPGFSTLIFDIELINIM